MSVPRPTPDANVECELLRLERALAERDSSGVADGLASLLADGFVEFGSSGRRSDRAATVAGLLTASPGPVDIAGFAIRRLADDVVLATYQGTQERPEGLRHSLRASIWVRRSGAWRMVFHQGTQVP